MKGYTSLTGSLATAEGLDNPLKAKLTWSPSGWLMHSWNPARYLDNGATVDVAWNELFLPKNLGTDEYFDLGKPMWSITVNISSALTLSHLSSVARVPSLTFPVVSMPKTFWQNCRWVWLVRSSILFKLVKPVCWSAGRKLLLYTYGEV